MELTGPDRAVGAGLHNAFHSIRLALHFVAQQLLRVQIGATSNNYCYSNDKTLALAHRLIKGEGVLREAGDIQTYQVHLFCRVSVTNQLSHSCVSEEKGVH